jgi:hypothetical protein
VFSLCFAHLLVSILSLLISVTKAFITAPGPPPSSLTFLVSHGQGHGPSWVLAEDPWSASNLLSHILLYLTLCAAIGTCLTVALISIER